MCFTIIILFSIGVVESNSQAKDIDGNIYKIVKIGNQKWTAENLNVEHYRNGDVIPQVQDKDEWSKLTTGAWCYYGINLYEETKDICDKDKTYGKLYNWYAVNDPRGLAPKGWHIPNDSEWIELIVYLGGYGEEGAGRKMKQKTTSWLLSYEGITNSSGFSAYPGGFRTEEGYSAQGCFGYFWSSEGDSQNACFCLLYDGGGVFRGLYNFKYGMSVRCIKN